MSVMRMVFLKFCARFCQAAVLSIEMFILEEQPRQLSLPIFQSVRATEQESDKLNEKQIFVLTFFYCASVRLYFCYRLNDIPYPYNIDILSQRADTLGWLVGCMNAFPYPSYSTIHHITSQWHKYIFSVYEFVYKIIQKKKYISTP